VAEGRGHQLHFLEPRFGRGHLEAAGQLIFKLFMPLALVCIDEFAILFNPPRFLHSGRIFLWIDIAKKPYQEFG
jgi:hypothetical protein